MAEGILVVGDSKEELSIAKGFLANDFKRILFCDDEIKALQLFNDFHPEVVILAFTGIDQSINFNSMLLRDMIPSAETLYETLIFCQKTESKIAFDLCKSGVVDDYVITAPVYEASKLKLSVIQSQRRVSHNRKLYNLITNELWSKKLKYSNELESLEAQPSKLPEGNGVPKGNEMPKVAAAPRGAKKVELSDTKSLGAKGTNQISVVLVDDCEIYLETTAAMLSGGSFNVTCESDSYKALSVILKQDPDIILLDYNMPKYNGIELLKAIRAHEKIRSKPVIMLTGTSVSSIVSECFASGANDYVIKPGDYNTIAEKIIKALGS